MAKIYILLKYGLKGSFQWSTSLRRVLVRNTPFQSVCQESVEYLRLSWVVCNNWISAKMWEVAGESEFSLEISLYLWNDQCTPPRHRALHPDLLDIPSKEPMWKM